LGEKKQKGFWEKGKKNGPPKLTLNGKKVKKILGAKPKKKEKTPPPFPPLKRQTFGPPQKGPKKKFFYSKRVFKNLNFYR